MLEDVIDKSEFAGAQAAFDGLQRSWLRSLFRGYNKGQEDRIRRIAAYVVLQHYAGLRAELPKCDLGAAIDLTRYIQREHGEHAPLGLSHAADLFRAYHHGAKPEPVPREYWRLFALKDGNLYTMQVFRCGHREHPSLPLDTVIVATDNPFQVIKTLKKAESHAVFGDPPGYTFWNTARYTATPVILRVQIPPGAPEKPVPYPHAHNLTASDCLAFDRMIIPSNQMAITVNGEVPLMELLRPQPTPATPKPKWELGEGEWAGLPSEIRDRRYRNDVWEYEAINADGHWCWRREDDFTWTPGRPLAVGDRVTSKHRNMDATIAAIFDSPNTPGDIWATVLVATTELCSIYQSMPLDHLTRVED